MNGLVKESATSKRIKQAVAYPGIFFGGGGVQKIQLTERTGIWGGSPLVRGSGGSCNLVQ